MSYFMKKIIPEDDIIAIDILHDRVYFMEDKQCCSDSENNVEIPKDYEKKYAYNTFNYINLNFIKSHFSSCSYGVFGDFIVKVDNLLFSLQNTVIKELFSLLDSDNRLKILNAITDEFVDIGHRKELIKELNLELTDNEELYLRLKE